MDPMLGMNLYEHVGESQDLDYENGASMDGYYPPPPTFAHQPVRHIGGPAAIQQLTY